MAGLMSNKLDFLILSVTDLVNELIPLATAGLTKSGPNPFSASFSEGKKAGYVPAFRTAFTFCLGSRLPVAFRMFGLVNSNGKSPLAV